jgi:succinyl-diaminopimelate desuccinylase
MPTVDDYLRRQSRAMQEALCEFLRIESVSTDPTRRDEVKRAAEWIAGRLERLGFSAEIYPTGGHPVVFGQSLPIPGAVNVLVYGHYDVQPPDPLEKWLTPPFAPALRDGYVYARGAADNKGQLLTHLFSAQAWMECVGRLPVNLKFLIEGEEEVGSPNLESFVRAHVDRLACDCVVISDGAQFGPDQPAITYGLRGIAYYQLVLTGPSRDLHSGTFGGTVSNPANALARMLSALIDEHGRVRLPGFYEDVVPLSDRERAQWSALPFDPEAYLAQLGVDGAIGEEGYTLLERRWARPTYDIHGLWSGYQGEGAKTIVPEAAGAKFSFRLVPNQTPEAVTRALAAMLEDLCPPGIRLELSDLHGSPAVLVPLDSPYIQAAGRAIHYAFGKQPVYTREGGSIPIVAVLHETLHADALLLGWSQDDDNIHSPNERFALVDFHRGIQASTRLWEELGRLEKRPKAEL